ncbi:ABC transporter ATP-binding protein [Undibacterium sp. RTI2.1]|uniref:ABC transporter ATP-binding protein n=1 Tax=unclassified Undibacterium TaxID=2630295 RepID=UPI002AB3959A|nr:MULTISPECIES: ABC transporter ATP-binding protein [unclassified Undibacterium]MDY7539560.1 ABC transporter ATP-binding protein [Undibacterium sp. 5I1]MEB0030136.1 ABC transporter ATP-binding protein [Undibacterium sp. RTI2.1]MEB0116664.1 ABC transporter ATP-binding protein [Undibacterium sp. RTI2.2]MEB0230490.1 ABC transporter ATP-binding protein [Undibacterium sp. 10I3]MEB0258609.1 ABC transporter ATP-binding protein [Undibacterium sp. 5I1]
MTSASNVTNPLPELPASPEKLPVGDIVVQLRGVRKTFNIGTPIATEVLHGIDLTLHQGEFCAVMGPSGSGKSTLLNIVGLLDRPSAGTIAICGEETTALDDKAVTRLRGHNIGFVFQYHHLITAFTALENVMMPMLGAEEFLNKQMQERAAALLGDVGLTNWQNNLAGNLSGGQQQRVALARALAMNPALLLADEPTGNLDTKSADEVFNLLRRFNHEQKTTILFVTHNPDLASRCDKTIQVIDGLVTG